MTNITSARPASYSSNTSAHGRCSAQVRMPGWNSVTCLPSRMTMVSLPIRSMRRDVAVEIDAHARPVEPRRHLLDVARLAGAVAPLHHHAPVVHEAGEQRQRRVAIEDVVRIERRHVLVGVGEGRHLQVACRS